MIGCGGYGGADDDNARANETDKRTHAMTESKIASIKVTAPEDEIKTLGEMIMLFQLLDKEAADRALIYLRDRFVKNAKDKTPQEPTP